jgi:cell division septation protein DedD
MRRILPILLLASILVQATGQTACTAARTQHQAAFPSAVPLRPRQGCSVVYATDGELMLGGNNEDYINPLTNVWFIPAEGGSFGRVYFGFNDYHAQGGMNDQGLFFDGLGLDESIPAATEGKQPYSGNLVDKAMRECATVACVVGLYETYYTYDAWYWQFLFGDATGESAIIEPAAILRQQGGYQVATNFQQSTTPPEEITCSRYREAVARLESMDTLSVEAMRDLLDAVHTDQGSPTLYSNVYDLKNRLVYLYYFHNYDDVVVLDLDEELAQGYHATDLASLFPPNPAAEAWAAPKVREYERLIEDRMATDLDPAVLQAYVGEYLMLPGWGPPDSRLTVLARERSLLLRFPDYRQHELFPASDTDFYYVAFLGSDFTVAYEATFHLADDRRVESLELMLGAEPPRAERLGPGSYVPAVATSQPIDSPEPTATPQPTVMTESSATRAPRATNTPTPAPERSPTSTPTEAEKGAGFPWGWVIGAVALVAVGTAGVWAANRGRR